MGREKILGILNRESKLIEIKRAKTTTRPPHPPIREANGPLIIFVGDTHGDLETSQKVIKDYLKPGNKIVFLGDYVDRGPFSKENLDFLLKQKEKYPEQIYLLQGNHEGHHILKFSPADFWKNIDELNYKRYTAVVENFPLAVVTDDIIALHGALPNLKNLKDINEVKLGSKNWQIITWGDFYEEKGKYLGIDFQNPFTGRPQFGRDYFFNLMERFKKKVLIRSHQPNAPLFMFDARCLTIFTSFAYTRQRTIAIADLSREIKTAKDLEIIKI